MLRVFLGKTVEESLEVTQSLVRTMDETPLAKFWTKFWTRLLLVREIDIGVAAARRGHKGAEVVWHACGDTRSREHFVGTYRVVGSPGSNF